MNKYLDVGSTFVIILTFVLFVAALFFKGLTHDLFLEAGVFLVSVKIIMMSYRNNLYIRAIVRELKDMKALMRKNAQKEIS